MIKQSITLMATAVLLLSGCSLPKYTAPAGAEVAKLRIGARASMSICVERQKKILVLDAEGYATIPAGRRETIIVDYSNYVYQGVSTYCTARTSFIPEAGQKYYMDFEIEGNRCHSIPFKESDVYRSGLEFEPTVSRSMECAVVR